MKKGFTLIELMASIIIISVISFIGVVTYTSVSKKIKIQQYENKVSLIESKAALFASDTGYLYTNVQELVNEGYIEADNDKGEVISPKDKKTVLNKYVVTITRDGEDFYGHFSDKEEDNINEVDRKNVNMEIKAYVGNSNSEIVVGEWTNAEYVFLKANITADYDPSKIKKITWYNGSVNLGSKEINGDFEVNSTYEVKVQQIANSSYRVEVEIESGEKSIYYQATRVVKIDRQKPIAYEDEIEVENAEVWTTKEKSTTIIGTDQNGSGIYGYYVTIGECSSDKDDYELNCERTNKKCNTEKYKVEKGNGNYNVCAMDNAGNVSNPIDFKVEKIDDKPPECEIEVSGTIGKNDWYVSEVSFNIKAWDPQNSDFTEGSGIETKQLSKSVISHDNKGETIKGYVVDKAGNKGECQTLTEIKVDVNDPTCTFSGENENWTKSDVTIKATCIDDASECTDATKVKDWSYTSGTHLTKDLSYSIEDNAGRTATCSKNGVKVYVDKESPTNPTAGAIGAVSGSNTTGSIKTAASGSNDVNNGSGVSGYKYLVTSTSTTPTDLSKFTTALTFTRSCGKSYYAWAYAVDKVGNNSNIVSLGSAADGKDEYSAKWEDITCSKKCGGGTKTRTNTCALVTTGLSKTCNTRQCCGVDSDGTNHTKEVKTYGEWGACDVSCGTGTKSRTVTTKYVSKHDSSIKCANKTTSTETAACDTGVPCTKTMYTCRYEQGDCVPPAGGLTSGTTWYRKAPNGTEESKAGTYNSNTAVTVDEIVSGYWHLTNGYYIKQECLTETPGACCTSSVCSG